MISGVKTCGNNSGYCLLGSDCTTDDDFLPDPSGNCDGLKRAFTPSASFTCCKFNRRSPQPETHKTDFNTKKVTSTEKSTNKEKLARNTRENIDPLQMDNDQLAKLNEIGLVVKKIVEQLLNETANTIKTDETYIKNETAMEANTIRNEIVEETPTIDDNIEIKESTINPLMKSEETLGNENLGTEIPPENKEENDTKQMETNAESNPATEPDTIEIAIDDEFRAEKNICQKTCKSEVIFMIEKKPLCYGTLLDSIWILTSATCASR